MAHLVCPRCQRTNPGEAVFCHFDGVVLRQAPGLSANQLPHEFVFPSGRRCRTFNELVQGCQYEWEDARDMLGKGIFGSYLASIGRMDLARAAQEGQAQPDPDIALHNFLNSLPADQVQGPRLDLTPRRLILGTLRAGDTRQVRLTVTNQGKGLLQGKLKVAEGGEWLHVEGAGVPGSNGQCSLKTAREQQVLLRIDTKGLPAPQTYSARLQVITNGGIVEVPVGLDLTSVPFARGPFQGVATPRELAERMRTQPQPAVPLLEGGDVERWFTANGWAYPVQGPTAKGVAAVQQFFEGMGLSKPPPVQLSETQLRLTLDHPEAARGQVTLRTPAKKWVYGHVSSDARWLRVLTPSVSGPQQAVISFEVDPSQMPAGRTQQAALQVIVNAGQKLALRVEVEVGRPPESFGRRLFRPFGGGQETPSAGLGPRPRSLGAPSMVHPIVALALLGLIYRALLALPADLWARVLMTPPGGLAPGSFGFWLEAPTVESGFVKHFVLITSWVGAVTGLFLLARRGSRWTDPVSGLVAGAMAGLMGSATLACLMPYFDTLARLVWRGFAPLAERGSTASAAWLWTPLWILVAVGCWTLQGAAAGLFLRLLGPRGVRLIDAAGWPLRSILKLCGLKRAAAFFTLQ